MASISLRRARRSAAAGAFTIFCWVTTTIALIALAAIFWSLLTQGFGGLNLAIFTQSTPAPGSPGGLLNSIVGSIIMCFLAMILAIVVGIFRNRHSVNLDELTLMKR